jgi:ribonuclease G
VNTGGFVGARNFDDTIFKTNLEAAQAIARQLRLRNLGGIIIVDFIDMVREEHQQEVLAEFRKQLGRPGQDHGRGLLAAGPGGDDAQAHPRIAGAHAVRALPAVQGKGSVKTARSVCYDVLREILREARQFNPARVPHRGQCQGRGHVPGRGKPAPGRLSDFIGKPISLQSENGMGQEQYDIVLL